MFSKQDIDSINRSYFDVLHATNFAVTLRSKCTGHQWHLIAREGRGWASYEVYHRHKETDAWHRQWGAKRLNTAIKEIRIHDQYQMDGRRDYKASADKID